MRLTIFSRLIIGYLVIFILAMAVSVYAIVKLRQFNSVTRRILNIDNRILDYEKKLADSTLSQLRYEKKYFITNDIALYDQFLSAKGEFDKFLNEALSIADTPQKKDSLNRIKTYHERYQSLVQEEVEFVKGNQRYSKKLYEQEKGKAADGILGELKKLEVYYQQDISDRMKTLGEAGGSARNVAIAMAGVAIVLIIATSFLITRSITKPLKLLMDRTKEVSEGVFKDDLNIASPPEVSELTKAFNSMCSKLRAVDKMKSDFFSMMSHELRTPLTSIKEGTALLQEGIAGTITDKQKKLLDIIAGESHRLIELVNSLLDLSKMEAGMMTYTFEQGNLIPLIERVMMEMVPLVEAKKIDLNSKIEEKLPLVKIDRERILQVLRNLVGNAVKFTPNGGQVRISARPADRGLEVSVADTGPGIRMEDLTTIFDKFQQVAPVGSYRIKGTGLGLAIVKHIILSHGGRIWAESKSGQGSTFIFSLPA
jgi:two-component system sensor histidine kinase GlrK